MPKDWNGTIVVCIHPGGIHGVFEGEARDGSHKILASRAAVLAVDVFGTGAFPQSRLPGVNKQFAGYTFGYNRPLLANRVHDILTALAAAKVVSDKVKQVHLIGYGKSGPWTLLARGLCGAAVERTVVDLNQYRFEQVTRTSDDMMLPGALKYGGLAGFAALCAPHELFLHNERGSGISPLVQSAYEAAGAPNQLHCQPEKLDSSKLLEWLLRT
jgi:hypothetical protein